MSTSVASVASKNRYDLLGNDLPEEEQPSKAPQEVTKKNTSSRKRDEKPSPAAFENTARGGGRNKPRFTGNDAAFHDREAGSDRNRSKTTVDNDGSAPRGGAGRGRGGRSSRPDRHSATGKDEHEKQVAHGWGSTKGESEWNDELAGAELAQKDAAGVDPADPNAVTEVAEGDAAAAPEEEEEKEEKTKTYDEYLAERAARQANLGPPSEIRRPNEGTREDKKWANAKLLDQDREQSEYFAGEARDKTRNRERKTKNLLDIEPRFVESRRGGDRGGRGGRGRGGERGGRADRSGNHSGRSSTPTNVDLSEFPALGA